MLINGIELTLDNKDHVSFFAEYLHNISHFALDSNESMFFARNLLQMEEKIYEQKFTPTQAVSLFPVDISGGSGLESIGYRKSTSYGQMKWANQENTKPNKVESALSEVTEVVRMGDVSYEFNFMDIRKAARAGVDLSLDGINNAKRAANQFIDDKILFGDDAVGIKGVFSTSYVSAYNPVTLTGSILAKAYDAALSDMCDILDKSIEVSKFFDVDTCIMSLRIYQYLKRLQKSNTDMTVLKMLESLYPNVSFLGVHKLKATAPASKDWILAYPKTPEVIQAKVPNAFEQLPTDRTAKTFSTTCISEVSSVQVKYANAITCVAN